MSRPPSLESYRDGELAHVSVSLSHDGTLPDVITDEYGNTYERLKYPGESGASSISKGKINHTYKRIRNRW